MARTARQQRDHDEEYYRRAKSYLDRKEYDRAVDEFNPVIENKGTRSDGALYWRAYAQNKQGRDDALSPAWRNCKKAIRAAVGWTTPRRCRWKFNSRGHAGIAGIRSMRI